MKIGIIGLGLMGGSFSYGIKELFPNSEIFYEQEVSLPIFYSLNQNHLKKICLSIEKIINKFKVK